MDGDDRDGEGFEALHEEATIDEGGRGSARRPAVQAAGGRYELIEQLGHGGMGEVLYARDVQLGRDVAIKRMRADAPSDDAVRRFLREAKIQGRLDHPAIAPVHELGRDRNGRPFFAMKKVSGQTLASMLEKPAPLQRLLRAFVDVCQAIEFAHRRGIIHRDLKPQNIMLGDFGETYVLDWGIAKLVGEVDDDLGSSDDSEVSTAAGVIVGTQNYMSPEQARGRRDLDARSDVYALGCMLFEILAGQPMHPKGAAGRASILAGDGGRPSQRAPYREIPLELDDLCVPATALDREARIQTAAELAETVQRYLDGDRDLAQRRTLAREHLASAQSALAAGDRSAAGRSASRALALDPTAREPAELISRLLLEPPAEVPREVTASFERASQDIERRSAMTRLYGNLTIIVFLPLLAWGGLDMMYVLATLALPAASALLLWKLTPIAPRTCYRILVAISALLIALAARICSPFIVTPVVAAVATVGMMSGPTFSRREVAIMAGMLCTAAVVPYAAEIAGLVTPTLANGHAVLAFSAPLFHDPLVAHIVMVVASVSLIVVLTVTMRRLRAIQHTARWQLHVLTWQLRHLVPGTPT